MFFSFATFALAALATVNAAAVNSTLLSRGIGVHCGTTDDATLSDCQQLLNDDATWNAAWAGQRNVCHWTNIGSGTVNAEAYNTACFGNCCVYYASKVEPGIPDPGQTRADAQALLGCGDAGANKINGLNFLDAGYGVCLSNGDGCGDCFDDSDFSGGCTVC